MTMARNGEVEIAWSEAGTGDPLLLIHGLGYGRWGWEPLVPLLAETHRVITFDNRGIGESSVPPGPYMASQMADDAVAVLDAAHAERAAVVGTSLGGMIAQELALARPDRVDRLVLACTSPGEPHGVAMPQVTVDLLAEAARLDPGEALRRFVENALGPEPHPEIVERILAHRTAQPQDPAGWAAQAAAGTTYRGGDRARRIAIPVLAVTGTADNVVDPANTTLLAEMIPDARFAFIEGAGHLFFWEQPEATARLIQEFLR